jgi:hypothetical protein
VSYSRVLSLGNMQEYAREENARGHGCGGGKEVGDEPMCMCVFVVRAGLHSMRACADCRPR